MRNDTWRDRSEDFTPCPAVGHGQAAFDAGHPLTHNPYPLETMLFEHQQWTEGWYRRKADHK